MTTTNQVGVVRMPSPSIQHTLMESQHPSTDHLLDPPPYYEWSAPLERRASVASSRISTGTMTTLGSSEDETSGSFNVAAGDQLWRFSPNGQMKRVPGDERAYRGGHRLPLPHSGDSSHSGTSDGSLRRSISSPVQRLSERLGRRESFRSRQRRSPVRPGVEASPRSRNPSLSRGTDSYPSQRSSNIKTDTPTIEEHVAEGPNSPTSTNGTGPSLRVDTALSKSADDAQGKGSGPAPASRPGSASVPGPGSDGAGSVSVLHHLAEEFASQLNRKHGAAKESPHQQATQKGGAVLPTLDLPAVGPSFTDPFGQPDSRAPHATITTAKEDLRAGKIDPETFWQQEMGRIANFVHGLEIDVARARIERNFASAGAEPSRPRSRTNSNSNSKQKPAVSSSRESSRPSTPRHTGSECPVIDLPRLKQNHVQTLKQALKRRADKIKRGLDHSDTRSIDGEQASGVLRFRHSRNNSAQSTGTVPTFHPDVHRSQHSEPSPRSSLRSVLDGVTPPPTRRMHSASDPRHNTTTPKSSSSSLQNITGMTTSLNRIQAKASRIVEECKGLEVALTEYATKHAGKPNPDKPP